MKNTFNKVLFKISGEALAGENEYGIDMKFIIELAKRLKIIRDEGTEVSIVVGGGNFWRGRNGGDILRSTSDSIGMMGTVINGLALQDALNQVGVDSFIISALQIQKVTANLDYYDMKKRLSTGQIAIFVTGTGNPYFSTDTTAAIRASEMNCEVILFCKNGTDGVYDNDPNIIKDAKKFDNISMSELIDRDLKVIDLTAANMCIQNKIPVIVFGMNDLDNLVRVIRKEDIGTYIKEV